MIMRHPYEIKLHCNQDQIQICMLTSRKIIILFLELRFLDSNLFILYMREHEYRSTSQFAWLIAQISRWLPTELTFYFFKHVGLSNVWIGFIYFWFFRNCQKGCLIIMQYAVQMQDALAAPSYFESVRTRTSNAQLYSDLWRFYVCIWRLQKKTKSGIHTRKQVLIKISIYRIHIVAIC